MLTVLDGFIFCAFVGGLPHKKGVCILDIFIALITLIQSDG